MQLVASPIAASQLLVPSAVAATDEGTTTWHAAAALSPPRSTWRTAAGSSTGLMHSLQKVVAHPRLDHRPCRAQSEGLSGRNHCTACRCHAAPREIVGRLGDSSDHFFDSTINDSCTAASQPWAESATVLSSDVHNTCTYGDETLPWCEGKLSSSQQPGFWLGPKRDNK